MFPDLVASLPLVPHSNSVIEFWGYVFNSAFIIVALIPALLFCKKPELKLPAA